MKMEIKVRCVCGSVFSFDDTPVDGRLEFPIACTNCGADCTAKANEYIQHKLHGTPMKAPEAKKGLLGFGKKRDEFAELDRATAPEAPAPEEKISETGDETSVMRLILAGFTALAVGCAGAVGWLYLAKAIGIQLGILAWVLGALVGLSSRLVAPRGHHLLGMAASLAAFIAIGGGQCLVSKWYIEKEVSSYLPGAYEEATTFAKEAATSEDDLRTSVSEFKLIRASVGEQPADPIAAYQKYQVADSSLAFLGLVQRDGQHKKLSFDEQYKISNDANVTDAEIAAFKTKVLPALQEFARGKPDQASYVAGLRDLLMGGVTLKSVIFNTINVYAGLWLLLGVGTAFKIARNAALEY